jgi:hypothetical protein
VAEQQFEAFAERELRRHRFREHREELARNQRGEL